MNDHRITAQEAAKRSQRFSQAGRGDLAKFLNIKETAYMQRKERRLAVTKFYRTIGFLLKPVLLPIVERLNNFLIKCKL